MSNSSLADTVISASKVPAIAAAYVIKITKAVLASSEELEKHGTALSVKDVELLSSYK